MQRKRALQNARFQQKKPSSLMVKSTMTLEEFLRSEEVTKSIIEFIIFKRACTSLSIYALEETNLADCKKMQIKYYSQLLISKICNLPACKSNNFQKKMIENKVNSLLKDLTLPKHKNDEWAMKYLAHFYEGNSQFQLIFYDSPFFLLGKQHILPARQINYQERKYLFLAMKPPKNIIPYY